MAKIVISTHSGAHQRVLERALAVLDDANISAEGRILLVYSVLRVAEHHAESALDALRNAGIGAILR